MQLHRQNRCIVYTQLCGVGNGFFSRKEIKLYCCRKRNTATKIAIFAEFSGQGALKKSLDTTDSADWSTVHCTYFSFVNL